ncbi:MAG: NFACT RNA binding domain-containing protein, partial [Planctomycetota bacterium]
EPELTILLNSSKTPEENMTLYFKKSKKLRSGREKIEKEMKKSEEKIQKLSEYFSKLNEKREDELAAIASEISSMFVKNKKPKQKSVRCSGPRRFLSSDGFHILVGRNQRENDKLTMQMAQPNDIFLHIGGYSGSHVIIRANVSKEVPKTTLHEAAVLAAHFSKARNNSVVDVSYTEKKYVRKPHGAKAGLVYLQRHKTLTIRRDTTLLDKLFAEEIRSQQD